MGEKRELIGRLMYYAVKRPHYSKKVKRIFSFFICTRYSSRGPRKYFFEGIAKPKVRRSEEAVMRKRFSPLLQFKPEETVQNATFPQATTAVHSFDNNNLRSHEIGKLLG